MHDSDADAGILFTPVRASAESEFNSAASLATWGWKDFKVSPISIDYQKHWAIDHVLKALGLSDKSVALGGTIQVHGVSHGDEDLDGGGFGNVPYDEQAAYIVGEKSYRVSGSEYTFGIDPAGVLIAMDRKSPRFAGQERYPKVEGDQLPKLQSFSDVAWSKWVSTAGKPTTMRYFLSLAIGNFETRSVIGKILNDARNTWQPAWPGVTFSTDTPQGAALLGTPNALAFSYFLIQHKSGLGNLRISKVTIFKDGRRFADPCLLFHVEAAPVLPKEPEKARSLEAQGLKQTSVNSYVRRHDLRAKL
ncbi:hypothetical protein P153DRAFT_323485 [Dothidotthia symphoricarpi CBS 119687]|uniref:Uncharacterized protein n=1 Tax=Dothidotthia symphoricarpi CBS 119687 TaxID=1392245 RepID=A0A6A6A5R7_9PLEO|nr:uncharacterized protein P153DRAFT_323485 [Dothidotthia symphoricarpi CBS 119687]KAF2126257.1 hypothetical protein P153DRAFT_323485 [Dothidotthia symphoricarpi CBS 119687]